MQDFLYILLQQGGIRVADKSIDRLKDKVREITRRNRGVKFEMVIKELNLVIRGWTTYFRLANVWLSNFRDLDGWIRRKLRYYRLKQCGRRYTIYKLLHGLGTPESKSWNAVMHSHGWWQISKKTAVGHPLSLNWFAHQGLQSLYLRMKVQKLVETAVVRTSMPGGVGGQRREPLPPRLQVECLKSHFVPYGTK